MFTHGKDTKFLLNSYDLSGFLTNVDMPQEKDAPEVTTFGNNDRQYIVGLRNSTMSLSGLWAGTSALAIDALATLLSRSSALNATYAPRGLTVGRTVYSVRSYKTNYSQSSPVDGVAAATIDLQGHAGVSRGISLHNLTARTCAGNQSCAYNLGANTSGGCVGYLHATAVTLAATEVVTIAVQDSATSSAGSWTDVIAFTAISCDTPGVLHERKTATGNVDQYVRAEWDDSSTDAAAKTWSATFTISFEQL